MSTQVLVLGGGYAGVMAANRLSGRDGIAVTLVNARPMFVHRLRLHQRAAGTHDAEHDYAEVLADGVRLVVGEATRIDAPGHTVELEGGAHLAYDHLVYAVGSHGTDSGVPGVAEHARPVSTFEAATRLRTTLDQSPDAPVVVVGGGPTGIETAAELAETGRDVTLVCGPVLAPYFTPGGRRSLAKQLTKLGVTIVEGARASRVHQDSVLLDDGRELPGIAVWATGFQPSDLARRSGLSTDRDGRLLTDETLTSIDDDHIVGAGDAVAPSGVPQRASCQAALPLAMHAADTVLARLAGKKPTPIDNPFFGQCVGLGRKAATFQVARTDDTAVGFYASGRFGGWLKETVTQQIVASLAREGRKPGSTKLPSFRARARVLERAHAVTQTPVEARVVA